MIWGIKKNRILMIVLIILIIFFQFGNNLNFFNFYVPAENVLTRSGQHFDQYIEMDVDTSRLDRTIDIDQSINILINFTYWTNLHDEYLDWIPFPAITWALRNNLIFGKKMPQQTIYVNITQKPDWADVLIMNQKIPLNAPMINSTDIRRIRNKDSIEINIEDLSPESMVKFTSSLIISPYEEAPAQHNSINLEITCCKLGRLTKAIYHKSIPFTPTFSPKIQIKSEKPIQIANPRDAVNFNITVTNTANKKVRVTPNLAIMDSKWNPIINPPFHDIVSGEQKNFSFSIYAPYDFGWYDDAKSFQINFTAEAFPLNEGNEVGGPYHVTLTVNNYGFSTPGFEFLIMFLSLLVIIIWKNISKNNN